MIPLSVRFHLAEPVTTIAASCSGSAARPFLARMSAPRVITLRSISAAKLNPAACNLWARRSARKNTERVTKKRYPAMTYSPAPLPGQYHRRRRA